MPSDGEKKGGASAHFPTPLVPGIAIIVASILVLASYFLLQSREILLNRAANNAETIPMSLDSLFLPPFTNPKSCYKWRPTNIVVSCTPVRLTQRPTVII